MIDILSEQKGGYIDGEYDANVKASDQGRAFITIVTPANGVISPELVEYATSKSVQLYQRTTEQDAKDPSRLRVSPGIKPLNLVAVSKGELDKGTLGVAAPGQSEPVDWNKK